MLNLAFNKDSLYLQLDLRDCPQTIFSPSLRDQAVIYLMSVSLFTFNQSQQIE